MELSKRRQRINSLAIPLPRFPDLLPSQPKDACPIDPELEEYDLRFKATCAAFQGKAAIAQIKAMVVLPMALHPAFHEEALLQCKSFLEGFSRTTQIALNDYLDKHGAPPTAPDGRIAFDMEVRLPSVDSSSTVSSAEPQIAINPAMLAAQIN